MPYAKIEPSGCGIHKNRAKLRLDFFLNPDDPHYEGDTPFHSHFIYPDKDATDSQIKTEIEKCLAYFYTFHQHCWDIGKPFIDEWKKVPSKAGHVRCPFMRGNPKHLSTNEAKVKAIIGRRDEFQVGTSRVPPQNLNIGEKGTIDIGAPAIDRAAQISGGSTDIPKLNPANATGNLDTVEIWVTGSLANLKVATFYVVSGNFLSTRDYITIGAASNGYHAYTGLSIDVVIGDYIGYCSTLELPYYGMDIDLTGAPEGYWLIAGSQIPCTNLEFYWDSAKYIYSLYGTGTESGEPITLELRSVSDTDAKLALETGIILQAKSTTGTRAALTFEEAAVVATYLTEFGHFVVGNLTEYGRICFDSITEYGRAIFGLVVTEIECRSSTDTRADLALDTRISLTLRSVTDTRAAITLVITAVTELSLRSSSGTRAALILDTQIALAIRSSSDTRASLTIEVIPGLVLRSSSETRADLALNTVIVLSFKSQTDTRANLALGIGLAIALRSLTDTRASLALLTIVSLELRSSAATRAAIALTVISITELELRAVTATRAAIELDTLISLALLSQTNTRATLFLTTTFRYQTIIMALLARSLIMTLPDRDLTMAIPARDLSMSMPARELEMSMPSRNFATKVRQDG